MKIACEYCKAKNAIDNDTCLKCGAPLPEIKPSYYDVLNLVEESRRVSPQLVSGSCYLFEYQEGENE